MSNERVPAPARKRNKFETYKQKWYVAGVGEKLRRRYNHDREAYVAAYRPDPEECSRLQEEGMRYSCQLLVSLELGSAQGSSLHPYYDRGRSILDAWCRSFFMREHEASHATDIVFLALDFEGGAQQRGIPEVGITALDTRTLQTSLAQDTAPTAKNHLVNTHFSFSCGHGRAFLFGDTVRRDKSQLRQVLLDSLTLAGRKSAGRRAGRIVLVGHNIRSELSNMKDIGLDLETLPVIVGLLDTAQLSREILRCG